MAYKLSFKINRARYTGNAEDINRQINQELVRVRNIQHIELLRIYQPSRDSIKVLFPDEKNTNKAITKSAALKSAGFEPRLSMALKAARTVYCFNLDDALLSTYTQHDIKESLKQAEWKVKDVYIMNSKKTFKIEMETTVEAKRFINSRRTSVGSILIHQESKEVEVDPTIPQCWECGHLNPKHISSTCPGNKRCIKCGNHSHQFFNCPIPKDTDRMNERDRANRFCIPCDARGDHTSLDHRQCPTKRRLVQEKINAARDKRKSEETEERRDTNLIQKTLEIANTNAWPALQNSQEQQQKTSTIVLLALLDEASSPGSFQRKLTNEMKKNGLPEVKYEPEPETATYMAKLIAGANTKQNTQVHRSNTFSGTTPVQSAPENRTIIKTSTLHTLGATSLSPQFRLTTNRTNLSKRSRALNSSISLDDSVIQGTSKKQKDDMQNSLSQPQKTSTQNMEEEMNIIEKHRHLKSKIKAMHLEISDKLKHHLMINPNGGGRFKKHFTIIDFANHLKNNDFIMDGEEKREILQETDNLISSNAGLLELSTELNYSGPHIVNEIIEMSSDNDSQDFH